MHARVIAIMVACITLHNEFSLFNGVLESVLFLFLPNTGRFDTGRTTGALLSSPTLCQLCIRISHHLSVGIFIMGATVKMLHSIFAFVTLR